jgi:hypothetical protein
VSRLTSLVLNFQSQEINLSELPVAVKQTPKKDDDENTSSKPSFAFAKIFPETIPDKGTFKNPFAHLLITSQTEATGSESLQTLADSRKSKTVQSPNPPGKSVGPEALEAAAAKSSGLFQKNLPEDTVDKPLFSFTSLASTIPRATTATPPAGENASTKSIFANIGSTSGGLFGNSSSGTGTTNRSISPLGDTSLKVAGEPKSGLFSGRTSPAPTKTPNSLK